MLFTQYMYLPSVIVELGCDEIWLKFVIGN